MPKRRFVGAFASKFCCFSKLYLYKTAKDFVFKSFSTNYPAFFGRLLCSTVFEPYNIVVLQNFHLQDPT